MKCLEFLYFYLLDETVPSGSEPITELDSYELVIPLSPSPFIMETTPKGRTQGAGLRDASSGSDDSYASGSSHSSSTSFDSLAFSVSSVSSSNTAPPHSANSKTPSHSPTTPNLYRARSRSLLMLQKDLDYVPSTPKKSHVAKLGIGHSRQSSRSVPSSKLTQASSFDEDSYPSPVVPLDAKSPGSIAYDSLGEDRGSYSNKRSSDRAKTTEQKKELLGNMLGNVDALVEGVKKAGIWGLG
jgi:hypothetical protein